MTLRSTIAPLIPLPLRTPLQVAARAIFALAVASGCGGGAPEAPADAKTADPPAKATPEPSTPAAPDSDEPDYPAALKAALEDGIEAPPTGGTTRRVDPFVVAWVTAAVKANGDRWLTRYEQTNAEGVASKGWQVRVPEGSPLEALGLQDGDVIEQVNDVPASDVAQVQGALSHAENRIALTVTRDAFEVTLSYVIEPGLAWARTRARLAGTELPPGRELPDIVADADDVGDEPLPSRVGGLSPPSNPSTSRPKPVPSPSGTKPKPVPKPSAGGGSSSGSSSSGSDKVTCSGSTCTVERAYFKSMVASPSKLQSQANIVPAIQNDVHSGYKLKTVKSGSAVHKMGFRSGDKVTHVNGYDLTSDLEALALYSELGSTSKFNVRYERGGAVRSKTIVVK